LHFRSRLPDRRSSWSGIRSLGVAEDTYETIRRRARAAGQSIQTYMREQVIEFAAQRTKREALATIEAALAAENSRGASLEDIVRDLTEDRR